MTTVCDLITRSDAKRALEFCVAERAAADTDKMRQLGEQLEALS